MTSVYYVKNELHGAAVPAVKQKPSKLIVLLQQSARLERNHFLNFIFLSE